VTPTEAVARVRERLGVEPAVEGSLLTLDLPVDRWQEAARFARDDLRCRYFSWLSATDWKEQGLEMLCRVENLDTGLAVMLKSRLGPGQTRCPTLTGLYRGADWMERECYDLLGVVFDGHPDLRRILLGQDWDGHPLRKDYAHDMPHAPYR
jgi:NADH-quinone oxidoreductase subunit C